MSERNDFLEGAAKALWTDLFLTNLDILQEEEPALADELGPGAGEDVMDYLPTVSPAALADAKLFLKYLLRENGVNRIEELLDAAAAADGTEEIDAEAFGHYVMMPALGHGVHWFDRHEKFPLKIPPWEASTKTHNAMFDYIESEKQRWNEE